jgi:hypothetical protein
VIEHRNLAHSVTLNLFQGPFLRLVTPVRAEEWMLKQVQHDDEGKGGAR